MSVRCRCVLHLCLLSILISLPIFAQGGSIVNTIPAPDYPYGIAHDGTHLWVGTSATNSGGDVLWKIDPADGAVVGTIPVPNSTGSYTVKGLGYDGTNLWVFEDLPSSSHPDKFYKIDPADGTILKTLDSPENNYIGGMDIVDGYIYYSQYYANQTSGRDVIIKMDTSGTLLDTIVTEGEQPQGVAFDGEFMWCAEDTGFGATRQEIYQYDLTSGTYTGTFIRNPDRSPRGMTWDGQHLWMVGYNNTNSIIYQIDAGGRGTPEINLSASDLDFGLTEIDQSKELTVSINNLGTADLMIDTIYFSHPEFAAALGGFPIIVGGDSTLAATIDFTPSGFGVVSGTMTIESSDPLTPAINVNLNGKGLYGVPTLFTANSSHDFGDVWVAGEGSAMWELAIINRGIQSLELNSASLSSSYFAVVGDVVPAVISADDTMTMTIRFTPEQAISYEDSLIIESNDTQASPTDIALSGNGQAGPFAVGYEFWNYQIPDNPATSFNEHRVLALKSIDDVSGDGLADVVVASRNYWTICLNGASSGRAEELWRFSSYVSNFSAGGIGGTNELPPQQRALAIANDLNGDGFQDVVIGTGGGNERVYALSGVDGSIIWDYGTDSPDSFALGDFTALTVTHDYNDDGINDVVAVSGATESYGGSGRRTAFCFDGSNGNIIWEYFVGAFTRDVEVIGDLNGNGSIDIAIGTGNGEVNSDVLVAVDPEGPTGPAPLWTFTIGDSYGGARDILRLDIPAETPDIVVGGFFNKVCRVDGETGLEIWNRDFGGFSSISHLSRLSDANGDGIDEVLVSSFADSFYCLSGADGSIYWSFTLGNFSWTAEPVADLDGDFQEDVLLASRNDNIYALDGNDGSIIHQQAMNSGVLQGATLIYPLPDADGNSSQEILAATDDGRIVALSGGVNATNIDDSQPAILPAAFELKQNFPNPFNPQTTIEFSVPERAVVSLTIFDILGRTIATPYREARLAPGSYQIQFHAGQLTSGVYYYQLSSDSFTMTRKMVLIR